MLRLQRTIPLFAILAFAACDAITAPTDEQASEAFYEGADLSAATLDRGHPAGYDDGILDIAGFGGFWFDRGCNLHVVLTAAADPEEAREALMQLLRRKLASTRCPPGATIIVHDGQFTYIELVRWLHELRPVGQLRGVSGMVLNVPANRIVVGVATRDVGEEVLEAARRLGIPTDAIVLRIAGSGRR